MAMLGERKSGNEDTIHFIECEELDPEFIPGKTAEHISLQEHDRSLQDEEEEDEDEDEEEEEEEDEEQNEINHTNADNVTSQFKLWHKAKHKAGKYLHSRPCTICTYLCPTLFLLAGFVGMIVVTVLILVPYVRARQYNETYCTPVSVMLEQDERRCSCGKGCSSMYPCLKITVSIKDVNYTSSGYQPSIIYENEAFFMKHCSFYPNCKNSQVANERAVAHYERDYGTIGLSYPCLYNPNNLQEVIRTRRFKLKHVAHGIIWSTAVFIFSLVCLSVIIRRHGCKFL